MNNLSVINISGIDCYERNGTAYLQLDTAARGLGFTQEKGGVEYVRWETVDRYLREIGFPSKLGKEDLPKNGERPEFIPENIFYRLAMKAKNEGSDYGLLDINVENQIMGRPSTNYWLTISFAKKGQTISHSS